MSKWSFGDEDKVRRNQLEHEYRQYLQGGPIPMPALAEVAGEEDDGEGGAAAGGGSGVVHPDIAPPPRQRQQHPDMPGNSRAIVYNEELMVGRLPARPSALCFQFVPRKCFALEMFGHCSQ